MNFYNKLMSGEKIILAGHRGNPCEFPENTMLGFESAVEIGCDMVETDLHMTKDGHVILCHDLDVARTTNGSGGINEKTLSEILELDAGSWKDEKFAGTKIPTIEEFVDFVKKTDVLINWELKDFPHKVGKEHAFLCVDKIIASIEENGLVEKSMINSASDQLLEYVLEKHPNKFVVHGSGIPGHTYRVDQASKPMEQFYDWTCLFGREGALTKEYYDYCAAHDLIPCVCFKDSEEDYKIAIEYGCKMFTSNDPKTARDILKKLGVR